MSSLLPIPAADVSVRVATIDDLAFIDALQKKHSHMVGFMHRGTLEEKIAAGEVLVAEEIRGQKSEVSEEGVGGSPRLTSDRRPLTSLGYCIGTDRYFKHDDVGIIYHLNVSPGAQRGFVGATLLKAMFDRAAYGCRLFCCWCAQDIEANHFWEAMGFVPLAYRAGSTLRRRSGQGARMHIFWQKRIREGDRGQGGTPWWFPSQTTGGAMRADRLVLPIPPGTHWSDAKPLILPDDRPKLEAPRGGSLRKPESELRNVVRQPISRSSGLFFTPAAPAKAERPANQPREKKPKRKNDPRLVAAARELKDRWLEHVNGAGGAGEMLIEGAGKYDVTRTLSAQSAKAGLVEVGQPLLPAA